MLSTKGGAHRLFLYIQIVKLLDNSSISIDKVEVVAYTKYILFYDHLSLYTTLIFHTKILNQSLHLYRIIQDTNPIFLLHSMSIHDMYINHVFPESYIYMFQLISHKV